MDNLVSGVAPRAVASVVSLVVSGVPQEEPLVVSGEVPQVPVSVVVPSPPPVVGSVLLPVVPAGEAACSPHLWCGWL